MATQPWLGPQQAPPDPNAATQTAQPATPATTGWSSDLANPAAMPISGPAPGTIEDLQQRASRAPQELGQQLQIQQQQQPDPNIQAAQRIAQSQGVPQQVNLSAGNPYSDLYQKAYATYQGMQPAPTADRPARVRSLLQNFFSGMGNSMMREAGLPTPDVQRQQAFQTLTTIGQLAQGWESHRDLQAVRDQQIAESQQRMQFDATRQPLELQKEQLGNQLTQAQLSQLQNRVTMSASDLQAIGLPASIAQRFADRPLSPADLQAVQQMQQMSMMQGGGVNPKIPIEAQEANAWLKQNPTKTLVDYQRYKATLVPAFNFNLQNGAGQGSLNPRQQATAQAILDGRMSPPGSFALKTPYWQAVMGEVFNRDPQWSEQRAQLRKGYTVGSQSKEINAINTALGHVGVLGDTVDALNNHDVNALNLIGNRLGIQFGTSTGDAVAMYKMIVHRVGPELSKAYLGAGGSAGERGSDEKDFDENLAPSILKGNVGMTAKLLRSKIGSLENQWDQNKAPSMPSFQDQFISPEAKQQLNRWNPQGGNFGTTETRTYQGRPYAKQPDGSWKLVAQ